MNTDEHQAPMTVWIVQQLIVVNGKQVDLALVGIFSTKEKAFAACRTDLHWCAPLKLDHDVGDDLVAWNEYYYPTISPHPQRDTRTPEQLKQQLGIS